MVGDWMPKAGATAGSIVWMDHEREWTKDRVNEQA